MLLMMPDNIEADAPFLDPRPTPGSPAFSEFDPKPVDSFFTQADYVGAFGQDLWIHGWSWLSENRRVPDDIYGPVLCGDITASKTLKASEANLLTCQTFVKSGATLTIEAGATIYGYGDDGSMKAPALIIDRGGKIMADGTKTAPITMTSALPPKHLPARGTWGGLIILGKAPTSHDTSSEEPEVEGIANHKYGGSDSADNSGTVRYVRVWYAGSVVGADNEINGITFAGVGSGTTVEYIEVAFNKDDGVECFGGTVNMKYVSLISNGDDQLDTDHGYTGKIQFLFALLGTAAHHGTEMDSKTNSDLNSQPRSYPQLYNALFIGQKNIPRAELTDPESSDDAKDGILRLREGTGGQFGNIILTNVRDVGVQNDDCGAETKAQDAPGDANSLYFSNKNIIFGATDVFESDCDTALSAAQEVDPELMLVPAATTEYVPFLDPRPVAGGNAYVHKVAVPSDGFFTSVDYSGAFGTDMWLGGLSWLGDNNKLPGSTSGDVDLVSESGCTVSSNTAWGPKDVYLTCQTFVTSGATLTIAPGTTIYASSDDGNGKAPALIIEMGAKLIADGTADSPITFTTAVANPGHGTGMWGGLIILGKAPTSKGTNSVEGLPEGDGAYGGSDNADNSGVLRYVRVYHGGSVIGQDNEINGITFAGVGSGTTCEYIEVAFNKDDGVEFFGGTVCCKYVSVMFVGDDAIDTDEGYQGKMQFVSVLVSKDGHHGTEMDSKTGGDVNSQPRSHPQIYNALFVGSLQFAASTASSDDLQAGLLRLREGTGGEFGNIILTNVGNVGVYQNQCGNEARTQNKPTSGYPDYLWISSNNIVMGPGNTYKGVHSDDDSCSGFTATAFELDQNYPLLRIVPNDIEPTVVKFDPRPRPGEATDNVDSGL